MAQSLEPLLEHAFFLGYNDKDKPDNLRDEKNGVYYMAMVKNAFCEQNRLIKRDGRTVIGNVPVIAKILGQDRHEPHGGSKYILRARNNAGGTNAEIEGWSGAGNWTVLSGATSQTKDLHTNFVMANNATYIFNGVDTVLKTTNGTSATAVATIPKGTGAAWFHNFMFVWGVSTNPDRLYISDINDPETYNVTTGYLDINLGDNEPIITGSVLKDELLIFKQSRVWSITGFGTATFDATDVGERGTDIGTVASDSVVNSGNDLYFLSYRGETPHFRSLKKTDQGQIIDGGIISDPIEGTMSRINTFQMSKCVGEFDGRRVWWAVPMDTNTENNEVLVYDTLTTGWVRFTGIPMSALHISNITGRTRLYSGSPTLGKSYIEQQGKSDDGVAIDYEIISPMYNPYPSHITHYKYLYINADQSTGSTLYVDNSPDGYEYQPLGSIDLTGRGARFGYAIFGTSVFGVLTMIKWRLDDAGGQRYYMQYKFYNNAANQDVTLRGWDLYVAMKGLRSAP